ncbi:2-amino-4-hydroxy-6-hydroxymethyldihydropteridinediphosphokinase [Corynebacterium appendicis CIP 107643]|uniref:2-amino-4-hydroxy-6-hydroxymethyldihydropteridine diphosphokinase n=1 Tax=Corynebacterium appendicis CIP 107643 TaxID=1161099 RepID=A0A1N7J6R1_9CORY|nr:2-amino-4-hydroxy-6-hydroxymethyldihydropteridine diphosphokinase [Corynebacterium appendicis]WJY61861.1 2-amino-4-hydroxy-6-hydroxymethyldihydropteridine pyrophosphokinase [Corynebacterium appendicis CIP 107643]SIS45048.1 2-amino-4-hydroxy-6-hydroxymethyldihydropteridinediphosphokinase [Corynebacterium appendicis CIP 107643]
MRAVLLTGSNLEDSRAHLASVEKDFADELVAASRIYRTAPWGGVDQDDFLNQILIVDVAETPHELLARCQRLEQDAHRVREVRWGPRTLDVDIVALYGDGGEEITVDTPELTVPHPRAHERAFVLVPWLEVDRGARLGGRGVDKLASKLDDEVTPL